MKKIIIVILSTFAVLAIAGLLIMLLWNWLVVGLFELAPISLWKGIGIVVTFSILEGFSKAAKKS